MLHLYGERGVFLFGAPGAPWLIHGIGPPRYVFIRFFHNESVHVGFSKKGFFKV